MAATRRWGVAFAAWTLSACGSDGSGADTQAASTAVAPDLPVMRVSPSANLLDGQYVDVVLSGPVSQWSVDLGMCPRNAASWGDCEYRSTAPAASDGTYAQRIAVRRGFYGQQSGAYVECNAQTECMVAAAVGSELIGQAITFRTDVPTPPPAIMVSPNADLVDGEDVEVSGSGFPPDVELFIAQCRPDARSPLANCGHWQHTFSSGNGEPFKMPFQVARTYFASPSPAGAIPCNGPEPCVIYVGPAIPTYKTGLWGATAPIGFAPMGVPRRGTVTLEPQPVTAQSTFDVIGTGWAEAANLTVRLCAAGTRDFSLCSPENQLPVQVGAGESGFVATLTAPAAITGYPDGKLTLIDCSSAPGACEVLVSDPRDLANTTAAAPLTVEPIPRRRGTFTLDLQTELVDDLSVRLSGSGWDARAAFWALLCRGPGLGECRSVMPVLEADASGSFRTYAALSENDTPESISNIDCAAPNVCSLVLADGQALANSVRIPVTFSNANSIDVSSSYTPELEALLGRGARISGQSPAELQRTSVLTTLWILTASGARSGAHLPPLGSVTHVTRYGVEEYRGLSELAARFDYTLAELQKTGTVFWSWILIGMPEPPPSAQ